MDALHDIDHVVITYTCARITSYLCTLLINKIFWIDWLYYSDHAIIFATWVKGGPKGLITNNIKTKINLLYLLCSNRWTTTLTTDLSQARTSIELTSASIRWVVSVCVTNGEDLVTSSTHEVQLITDVLYEDWKLSNWLKAMSSDFLLNYISFNSLRN